MICVNVIVETFVDCDVESLCINASIIDWWRCASTCASCCWRCASIDCDVANLNAFDLSRTSMLIERALLLRCAFVMICITYKIAWRHAHTLCAICVRQHVVNERLQHQTTLLFDTYIICRMSQISNLFCCALQHNDTHDITIIMSCMNVTRNTYDTTSNNVTRNTYDRTLYHSMSNHSWDR